MSTTLPPPSGTSPGSTRPASSSKASGASASATSPDGNRASEKTSGSAAHVPNRKWPLPERATEERLLSLDAYRGLIMIALAFNGFGLAETAARHLKTADSEFWQQIKYQFSHVDWAGCAFWDLIQPSFMFMVGVSMAIPTSSAKPVAIRTAACSFMRSFDRSCWFCWASSSVRTAAARRTGRS